jgi:hypothetical protein
LTELVDEDINKDGTSIYLTSGKIKVPFKETIGKSKTAFSGYPSSGNLTGDQLIVNSDRIILSAKASEFIKEFASTLMTIETTLTSPKTKKKVQNLREELKYSSPLSNDSVKSIEKQLTKKLETTKFNELDDKEVEVVINQFQSLMNNRNLLLKK